MGGLTPEERPVIGSLVNVVRDELEELISNYSKICTQFGVMPNMMLNKEMLNINRKNVTEDEFLHALFAYLNTLQDISAQFINKMCDTLESKE